MVERCDSASCLNGGAYCEYFVKTQACTITRYQHFHQVSNLQHEDHVYHIMSASTPTQDINISSIIASLPYLRNAVAGLVNAHIARFAVHYEIVGLRIEAAHVT